MKSSCGSLARLRNLVKARRVSSEELVNLAAKRIEEINPVLNAVTVTNLDRACKRARELDRLVKQGDGAGGLLFGIPVLAKENENVEGYPSRWASRTTAGAPVATFSDFTIKQLERAGGIVIGKSNAPEYAFEVYTNNPQYGVTRNPWALDLTPGGSSGGAAAALMSGMVPIATGTDGGGSVRIPAAICGLLGLKPSRGAVPRWPMHSWMDLSSNGIFGSSVADVETLVRVHYEEVAGDLFSRPIDTRCPAGTGICDYFIAHDRVVDWGPLMPEVAARFKSALSEIEGALGLPVDYRSGGIFKPERENPDDDWFLLATVEQREWLGEAFVEEHANEFDPVLLKYLTNSRRHSLVDYIGARRRCYTYSRVIDNMLETGALLITPTVATTGISAEGVEVGTDTGGVSPTAINTVLQNMTGHPAISLPAGALPNGWRFGLQVTAPRGQDGRLLALARSWEQAYPWPTAADGYKTFLEAVEP